MLNKLICLCLVTMKFFTVISAALILCVSVIVVSGSNDAHTLKKRDIFSDVWGKINSWWHLHFGSDKNATSQATFDDLENSSDNMTESSLSNMTSANANASIDGEPNITNLTKRGIAEGVAYQTPEIIEGILEKGVEEISKIVEKALGASADELTGWKKQLFDTLTNSLGSVKDGLEKLIPKSEEDRRKIVDFWKPNN